MAFLAPSPVSFTLLHSFEMSSPYASLPSSPTPNSSPAVSIIEPEGISPMMLGETKQIGDDFSLDRSAPKQHRSRISHKLKGRKSIEPMKSPYQAAHRLPDSPHVTSQQHLVASPSLLPQHDSSTSVTSAPRSDGRPSSERSRLHRPTSSSELHAHVSAWLESEKRRRADKNKAPFRPSDVLAKIRGHRRASKSKSKGKERDVAATSAVEDDELSDDRSRRSSDAAIDELASILETFMPGGRRGSRVVSRRSSLRKLTRSYSTASSDVDYFEGDRFVPWCDVTLDNSRTLAFSGGSAETPGDSPDSSRKAKEREAWAKFKYEIVRLTHTLRLKGWRRVSMERSGEIGVERLSGALTNAVYAVEPPKDVPLPTPQASATGPGEPDGKKSGPKKLLLRIYGPQVEHLIDREAELAILRRLCRKNIGPNLLGTFANGRFEEFLNAKALTPDDMRKPETSRQIAKRMRELHEGIELLDDERDGGPFVWRNWDKWVDRCRTVVHYVDDEKHRQKDSRVRRGSKVEQSYVCGTEWDFFKSVYEKYRKWQVEQYGGMDKLKDQLVFAHNDVSLFRFSLTIDVLMGSDTIRQYSSHPSPFKLPSHAPSQQPQDSHCHRLRVCQSQHPRPRIRQSLHGMVLQLSRPHSLLRLQHCSIPNS